MNGSSILNCRSAPSPPRPHLNVLADIDGGHVMCHRVPPSRQYIPPSPDDDTPVELSKEGGQNKGGR